MPDWAAYQEASNRGILPPEKAELYNEAINRGLVPQEFLPTQETQQPVQQDGKLEYATDVARTALQGQAVGLGDEYLATMQGGVPEATRAAIYGYPVGEAFQAGYQKELGREREQLSQFREESPVASVVSEIGGAIFNPISAVMKAPTIAAKGAEFIGRGASTAGKLGRTATVGGASAGAYGAGTAEGGLEERGVAAAKAAPAGAVIGAGIPALASVANKGYKVIRNAIKGDTVERILQSTGDIAQNTGKYIEELKQGSNLSELSKQVAGLTRTVRKVGGEAAKTVEDATTKRMKTEAKRVASSIHKHVSGKEFYSSLESVAESYKQAAEPIFNSAYKVSDAMKEVSKPLQDFVSQPIIKKAIDKARKSALGIELEGLDDTNLKVMQAAKESIDDNISTLYRTGSNKEANALNKYKNSFLKAIDADIPQYKQAREVSGEFIKMRDAFDIGRNAVKKPKTFNQVKKQVENLSDVEKDASMVGLRDELMILISNTADTASSARKIISKPIIRSQIKAIVGEPKYKQFKKELEREVGVSDAYNKIMSGSQSDINFAEGEQVIGVLKTLGNFVAGSKIGAVANVIERNARGINNKNALDLARALTEPDEAVKYLTKIQRNIEKNPNQQSVVTQLMENQLLGLAQVFGLGAAKITEEVQ